MADNNREQQGRDHHDYRHRYGGGYSKDRHEVGNYRGTGYDWNEEQGYNQDIGREHTDRQGNRSHIITGNRRSDYAGAMSSVGNRDTGRTGGGGPHRGKGPRGYERSQDRIREDVCERLTDDAMIDATNVEVRVENNEVVLSGTVHNREEKRRAEDLAEAVAGVRNVENRLRVEPASGNDTNYYREYNEQGRISRGGQ